MVYHFVDVGAHKGVTARKLAALDLPVHIHLFEPNPVLMEHLRERLGDNPCVFFYEQAMHSEDGSAEMWVPDPKSQSSSLYGIKKTSPGSPTMQVETVDGARFLRNLVGPIILYSNCEGSEFDFVPKILDDPKLCDRIVLWSVSFHHGQHKIPQLKPQYLEIEKRMNDMGIVNVIGHFDNNKKGEVDDFVRKIEEIILDERT